MTAKPEKQPWLKWFPCDWRGDLSLASCSLAARGLWMEMLNIMADATPRGSLCKDGEQYTAKRLAGVARAPVREVEKLLVELEAEGVFSRDPDGTIYSRRMRRDIEKAENDRANGGKGGNPKLKRVKAGVNPPDNGEDKAQKPEAINQKPDPKSSLRSDAGGGGRTILDRFQEAYPIDAEEDGVRAELDRRIAEGIDPEAILDGAKRYAAEVSGRAKNMIKSPVRWLQLGCWKDGLRKAETLSAATSNKTFVKRGEGSWDTLEERYRREKGTMPPDSNGGWYFPNEWLTEVHASAA